MQDITPTRYITQYSSEIVWCHLSRFKMVNVQYKTLSILLNIMFHSPMGRFQLELIYYLTYFSTVQHVGWDDGGKIGKIINQWEG